MDRSYRIAPDGRSVICDAVLDRDDNAALGEALAWRREQLGREGLEDAGAVSELRALMTLADLLAITRQGRPDGAVSLARDQARGLCEIAGAYVTDRDVDGYQAPEERDRIARLRELGGPLMDLCCDFAAAEDEAREYLVSR